MKGYGTRLDAMAAELLQMHRRSSSAAITAQVHIDRPLARHLVDEAVYALRRLGIALRQQGAETIGQDVLDRREPEPATSAPTAVGG